MSNKYDKNMNLYEIKESLKILENFEKEEIINKTELVLLYIVIKQGWSLN